MGPGLRPAHRGLPRGGRTLKILDVTEFFSPWGGGVRTYLQAKAEWFTGRGDAEHVIAVPADRDGEDVLAGSRMHLLRGPPVPASPGYHFLSNRRRLRAVIRAERPDIVEVGSPFLAPLLGRRAALEAGSVLVGFFHCDARRVYVDHGLRRMPDVVRRAVGALLEAYLARTYGSFRATVAATPSAAAAVRRLGVGPVVEIPLGVDTHTFHPGARDPTWRAEVGAAPGRPVGLYVGRLATERRLDVLLEALPGLHRDLGLKLVLVGEGHLRPDLEEHARACPDMLSVLPFQPDRRALARIYASADFFVAPFPMETFGLAAVEAMASGLPLVGVRSGGIADLLDAFGAGFGYGPGHAGGLGDAVRRLLEGDRDHLARLAREAAVARYSWERTFERLLDLYRGLLSGDSSTTPTSTTPASSETSAPSA